jgi:HAD superfamily hydrolase (TIGR01484 family)
LTEKWHTVDGRAGSPGASLTAGPHGHQLAADWGKCDQALSIILCFVPGTLDRALDGNGSDADDQQRVDGWVPDLNDLEDAGGFRVVVSDLDGTLLDNNGAITQRTLAVVEEIKASGAKFIIATARPLRDAIHFARELSLCDPVICQNGAVVAFSPALNSILDNALLPVNTVQAVIGSLRTTYPNAVMAIDYPTFRIVDPNWPGPFGTSPSQATLWSLKGHELPRRRAASIMIRGAWSNPDEVWSSLGVTATTSLNGLIEISRKGVDKAYALRKICRRLQVSPASIVAFGDMLNDRSMISYSGLGVAVANAPAEVRSAADLVAPTNNEDGVARILEDLLKQQLIRT